MAPAAAAAVSASPMLTRGWFAPFVGTTFTVRDPHGAIASLVLSTLTPLARTHGYASAAHAAERCFSAQFSGDGSTPAVGGLCELEHPDLGRFTMMISPVRGDGRSFEAVFNRVKLA